jgi:hypothetical protein
MSKNVFAVLLDVSSIQKYIFASNKLKDNLGASYLVEKIYQDFLSDAYKKVLNIEIDTKNWSQTELSLPNDPIGYIGGGNALVFFEEESKAQSFLKEWTKLLLVKVPSLNPISAYSNFDLDNFETSKNNLFKKLRENKAMYISQTKIQSHGITAECSRTGLSSEEFYIEKDKKSYISMVSKAKVLASEESKNSYDKYIKSELKSKFEFTDEFEELGQKEQEKNHIAVVHIDGNDMGDRFKKTKSLNELRKLSIKVSEINQKAFQELINYITDNIESLEKEFNIKTGNKYILPIRPIIIGGDDITFVTPGKLGILFAKIFLENFEKIGKDLNITACSGISIVKSKYPFFKAYQLAEELCENAKKVRKENKSNNSMLDFHISTGSIFDNIEIIREEHFRGAEGSLIFRPYEISSKNSEKSLDLLVKNSCEMKKNLPSSKIKELREVLTLGKDSIKDYLMQLEYREKGLPKFTGKNYHEIVFQESKTPYFDMMEFMEFYPEFLIKKESLQEVI